MRITKEQLKQIIKEELDSVLSEQEPTIDEKWNSYRATRTREWEDAIVKPLFGDNEPSKRVYRYPESEDLRQGTEKISEMLFNQIAKKEFPKKHAAIWKPGSNTKAPYDEVKDFVSRLAEAFFLQTQVNPQDGSQLELNQASPSIRAKVRDDLDRAKQRSIGMIISPEDAQQRAQSRQSTEEEIEQAYKDFMKVFKFWNGEDETISKIGGNTPQPITAIIGGAFDVEDKDARQIAFTILKTLIAKTKPTFMDGSRYSGERFGPSDVMKMLADFVTGEGDNLQWQEGEFEKYVLGVLNNIADRKPELEKRRKQQQEPEAERPSLRQRFSRFFGKE
jgi:hypothetical protein